MKKQFIPKPRNLIFDTSDFCENGLFRVRIGSFLRHAQNSELKIGVPVVSWMLVAGPGPHSQKMAGDQLLERDVLSFSPESRYSGRQLKPGELRQRVCHDLYVLHVVCPPHHHTLEASAPRGWDSPTICLPKGSSGQIRRVYVASRTPKAQTGKRRAPPTPALIVERAVAPPSVMPYSSGLLRGLELAVTGPTSAISSPILI